MKVEELSVEKNIENLFKNINASEQTKKSYLQAMQQYTEFTKMTPEELLDEAEAELNLPLRKRNLKQYILDFREHLQKQGLSDHTIRTRIVGVQSFYASNDIILPKIKGESKARTKKENDKIPTKEDLQDCIAVCDPLEKAIMLTGISSGLASNEIRNLKLSEFKNGYDPITEICTLPLRRGKTNVDFITFLSPEATRAIWEYLKHRDRSTNIAERQDQIEKQRITEDSYLFVLKSVPAEYLETRNEEVRKIGEKTFLKLYSEISEKSQKNTQKWCYNYIRSHTMRKYFFSTLINAGCDSFHVEFWMGHALDDTQAAYFRATVEKSKELYMKYVPYLVIQKEVDITKNADFIRMEKEIDVLKRDKVVSMVERDEFERLKLKSENQLKAFEKANDKINLQYLENQLKRAQLERKTAEHPELIKFFDEQIQNTKVLIEDHKKKHK